MELENYIAQISRGRGMTIKQMPSGAFAAKHKKSFFHETWRPTAREARIERLKQIGRQANDLLRAVTEQLRELQAIHEDDPTGWLA